MNRFLRLMIGIVGLLMPLLAEAQQQDYFWVQNRYPLNVVPKRYAGATLNSDAFFAIPWKMTATTLKTNDLTRVTPSDDGNPINGSVIGSVVTFQLAANVPYKRILAVFVGNALAQSFTTVGGNPRVIQATLPKLLYWTGFGNTVYGKAGLVLERERDTIVTTRDVDIVDSSSTPEDRYEKMWQVLQQERTKDTSYHGPPIRFTPTHNLLYYKNTQGQYIMSGVTGAQVAIYGSHSGHSFLNTSDSLQTSVQSVTIGGLPVVGFEVKSDTLIYATVGTVRSGQIVVNLRCKEISSPVPMLIRLAANGTLPARDSVVYLPQKKEYILPLMSGPEQKYIFSMPSVPEELFPGMNIHDPTITSFYPKSGNAGTTVTIQGKDFSLTNKLFVWIGGIMAADVVVDSPTQLRARIGYTRSEVLAPLVGTTQDGYTALPSNLYNIENRIRLKANGAPLGSSTYPNARLVVPPDANGKVVVMPDYQVSSLMGTSVNTRSSYAHLYNAQQESADIFRYNAPSLTIATLSASSGSEGDSLIIQGSGVADYSAVRQIFVCGVPVASFTRTGATTLIARLGLSPSLYYNNRVTGRVQLVATAQYLPSIDSTFRAFGQRTDRDSLMADSDQDFTFIQHIMPTT